MRIMHESSACDKIDKRRRLRLIGGYQTNKQPESTTTMSEADVVALTSPGTVTDPLSNFLRAGVGKLIQQAVEVELQELLSLLVTRDIPNYRIAEKLDSSRVTVIRWRNRFVVEGCDDLLHERSRGGGANGGKSPVEQEELRQVIIRKMTTEKLFGQ